MRLRHLAIKEYKYVTPNGQTGTYQKTVNTKTAIYNDKGKVVLEQIRKDACLISGRSKNAKANAKVVHGFVNTKREVDVKLDEVYTPAVDVGHTRFTPRFGKAKRMRVR